MPSALIIGAGPAGSLASLSLRKRAWNVTLIEQHHFPRDKVCGECLSPLGFDVLLRSNVSQDFLQLNPVQMSRTIFHSRAGETCEMNLPHPMWGISRRIFDDFLLNQARRLGVTIRQPARCESLLPGRATIHDLHTNQIETIQADCIILADGKCALSSHRPPATTDLGIKVHWSNVNGPRDAIELFTLNRHYGGLAPINEGLWNSAFSVPSESVRTHAGNLDQLLDELIAENRSLAARLQNAHKIGPILASPLPRFAIANRFPPGIIPIGNAAAAIEPIGGEGMGLALRSAELAAEWIHERQSAGLPLDSADLAPHYRKLWKTRSIAYRAAAIAISRNSIAAVCVPLLSSSLGQQTFSRVLKFLVRQDARPAQTR